jgi:HAE1 family hydrophobic/amphiphilic exporter-1
MRRIHACIERFVRAVRQQGSSVSHLAVLSLKNRALIALITIVAAVFGGLALTSLKQELIPSIEFPQLSILSTYPAPRPMSSTTTCRRPSRRRSRAFRASSRRRRRARRTPRSSRRPSPTAPTWRPPEQKILQAINRIKSTLPTGVEPNVVSFSIDDLPVIALAVTGYGDEKTIQAQLRPARSPTSKTSRASAPPRSSAARASGSRSPRPGEARRRRLHPDAITDALKQNGVLFPAARSPRATRRSRCRPAASSPRSTQISALPLVPTSAAQFEGAAKNGP